MSKSDIRLINLSNYMRPPVEENISRGYVLNGRNNSFYQIITDRNNGSVTNSSINSTYKDLIYGRGLSAAQVNSEGWIKLQSILSPKDLRMIAIDFQWFGEASLQIIETKGKKLESIKHLPQPWVAPAIANEDNEIESYFVSQDWSNTTKNKPEEFGAFGTKGGGTKIYKIKPYKQGSFYFADPDYLSCLPYCEIEEETSNLYNNSIKQGLSGGYVLNVDGGHNWTAEEKDAFEESVKRRLTGSTQASSFIVSFNGSDVSVSIEPFPVNDNVHKQWGFLTEESKRQIMSAHKVISPSIIGLSTASGFSSVADEMDKAEEQLVKRVIAPKQRFITDAIEEILVQYGINLNLFFKPLTEVVVEPVQLGSHCDCKKKSSADDLINLGEEENLNDYYIYDEIEVDYEEIIELASTGTARPNAKSEQDSKDIVIRYRYVGNESPQRDFCTKMMSADKIYRKEDIIQMESKPVNAGWGLNGADTYSIWLYKGGGNCHHKWNRVIYVKKGKTVDVNSPLAKTTSTTKARSKGYKVPTNDSKVSIAPINMPNQGFVNK